MEELTVLLEKLAEKLGTTTEYLWGVLIQQAHVSAITSLVKLVMIAIIGLAIYKIHLLFLKEDKDGKSLYEKGEEFAVGFVASLIIVWLILFFVQVFSIGNIINGFFNPEYWALKEVLGLI